MRNAALPVTLIVLGVLGLVWYFGWFPDFDAITSIGLVTKMTVWYLALLGLVLLCAWWLRRRRSLLASLVTFDAAGNPDAPNSASKSNCLACLAHAAVAPLFLQRPALWWLRPGVPVAPEPPCVP